MQVMRQKRKACQYVDNLMSTWNPCHPDEFPWVKPKTHPSKVRYENISPPSYDDDYIDLLNMVQRHTNCNSAYCLKQNEDGTQSCRFSYSHQTSDKTHLEFEKVKTKDGSQRYRAKVVTARNDPILNRHQRLQLQGWRENCDINVIIDYHSCVEYLTKYASKGKRLSSVVRDAFVSVVSKLDPHADGNNTVKKLMMKAIGQRDMSAQNVMHQILSLKLFSSSFQVVTTSLEVSRKIKLDGNQPITEPSVLDYYANRIKFIDDIAGVVQLNFLQFVSSYFVKNDSLCKRKNMVHCTYILHYTLYVHFRIILQTQKAQILHYFVSISY